MSETSTPTDRQAEEARLAEQQRSATRQAWAVVAAMALVVALVIIQFSFTTANDESSIDGSTATSSQFVE